MTSRIGSDQNFIATTSAGILDDQANSIVSSDTTFGSSPLGVAARAQALFGIANANFNLTPPDPTLPIVDNDNPLPYWTVTNGTEGDGSAIAVFDDATSTWGVELSLGTSITDAAISMTTRSFLLNDDNLALRQRALSVLSKSGTAGGTAAQWNLVLSAEYFSEAGNSLSTHAIGTVTDVTTWTSIAGTTTAGGSAISSSAAYVDLTFTMTALGTVTGSAKATIKSLLLQTSTPAAGGGGSFLVTETFTSSGTWNKPAGVDYLSAVLVVGAGGGGGGGGMGYGTALQGTAQGVGGGGGGGGGWVYVENLYLEDSSYSIGIGAGGSGGTAGASYLKGFGTAGVASESTGGNGGAGGASSFGTLITSNGGGGGFGGTGAASNSNIRAPGRGGTAGAATHSIYGAEAYTGGTGGGGSGLSSTPLVSTAPFTFATYPLTTTPADGANGSTAITSGGSSQAAAASTAAIGFIGGGAAAVGVRATYSDSSGASSITLGSITNATGNGAGGGAGASAAAVALGTTGTNGTVTVEAGSGGNAASNSGGGGGGGGGAAIRVVSTQTSSYRFVSAGSAGDGADGVVIISYVG